jgi:hypothetical protein
VNSYRCISIAPLVLLAAALSTVTAGTADDLIALAKSGVDEEVVKAYIENSATPFALTSADIVTLKDLGLSSKLIIEALKHDQQNDSVVTTDTEPAYPESTAVSPAQTAFSPVTAPPPDEQNISFFYSALYPYGTWINVDGNWCWQPNATTLDDDWAPYCNHGQWVWTDYGWTWVSKYTWGWAPFHYGRWFRRSNYGWLWQPDNEWGPAWVAWRTGSDYCGWAPLPPRGRFVPNQGFYFGASLVDDDAEFGLSFSDFYFVPIENFHDRHLFGHVVPSSHAENIYKKTVFQKNSFAVVNNHLVNQGVPVSVVEKATKTRINPVVLTEEHLRPGEPIQSTTVSKNKLMIYKPSISTAAPENPLAVREKFTKNASGFGRAITPQANPQSWQSLQNSQRNAAEIAAKNQGAVVRAAQMEKTRLNDQAQKETDQSKQAALKGEQAVQEMKARQAQQHVQRAQSWKPPQEIIIPKAPQPAQLPIVNAEPAHAQTRQPAAQAPERQPSNAAPASRPTEQLQAQVRELNSEARVEQQRRETVESTVRTQAQSQWQQQPSHQQQAPTRGEVNKR